MLHVRGGDDDFGVNEVLVKFRVLTVLVGGGDELMALVLEPFSDAQLVFCGA